MSKTTALQKTNGGPMSFNMVWKNPDKIRAIFAKDLNDVEFSYFMGLSEAAEANPFLGEIWAVKYKSQLAVYLGRNQFRKIAHRQDNYDFHYSSAVYSNDEFEIKNGIPNHTFRPGQDRGELIGAVAVAGRKGSTQPNYAYVELKEYKKDNFPTWQNQPATFIEKVAEAHVLKMTWYENYGGNVYSDAEQGVIEASYEDLPPEPEKAEPKKAQNGLNYESLERLMIAKLGGIDKVREYLDKMGLKNVSDMNAMQYRFKLEEFQKMQR